ncbi:MAG: hypothetical protein QXL97_00580 [Candidatus Aenigmatarchaeota archaeon]
MENYIENAILSLIESGIITFVVPSILFMTLTYVFLTRSKIVESKSISGLISFLVFLLVLVFPVISGIDISIFLSTFFVQMFIIAIIFLVGLIVSSMFYPDFLKVLERFQNSRMMLSVMLIFGILVLITSGMLTIIISTLGGPSAAYEKTHTSSVSSTPSEITFTLGLLVLLIILAIIIVIAGRVTIR